jgi:hypothetical protein
MRSRDLNYNRSQNIAHLIGLGLGTNIYLNNNHYIIGKMVNEDIVTVLRNAVNNGEPLQHAIQILTNSGYDPQQVQEASKYIQGGTMNTLEPKPGEQLIMAQNKSLLGRNKPANQPPMTQQNPMQQRKQIQQNMQKAMQQQPSQNIQQSTIGMQQPMNQPNQMQKPNAMGQKDPFAQQPMNQNEIQELTQPVQKPTNPPIQPANTTTQQPRDFQNNTQNNTHSPPGIKLKKKSYKKEIILLVILLFLIGILGSTIFFRKGILTFLSG